MWCVQGYGEETCEKKPLKDLRLDWRMILKWNFKKWDSVAWTRLMWAKIETCGGLL